MFAPTDTFCVAVATSASAGTPVYVTWLRGDQVIDTRVTRITRAGERLDFSLPPPTPWPPGDYRVIASDGIAPPRVLPFRVAPNSASQATTVR